ncbi:MAG: type II toxin-antitoxin system Phd/YefM family antitoxin [Chloroflexi bacterium]|nr:type II toxin-antitoxin system Phd/YefM family antitoxin [Chloroflexota bacterium]
MATIGVRELRQQTTEILRKIREEKAEYIITHQGRPVALLLPVDAEAIEAAMLQAGKQSLSTDWEAYNQLADELRKNWPQGAKTKGILDDLRR